MAVILYREGNTHTNRGIKCEARVFPVERMQAHLDDGWVLDPVELVTVLSEPVADFEGDIDDGMWEEWTLEELRKKAKEAGFQKWETARTKTLKKVLGL